MLITLTTDFGHKDGYPAIMKGVILSRINDVEIIDFTHDIPAQDIRAAAHLINSNFRYFPAGSLHVIVVDPGVGSTRDIILLSACDHLFLAPDNGVLSHIIHKKNAEKRAFIAERPDLYIQPVSSTFHGRDIFSPLAAYLASGQPPESIGPEIKYSTLKTIQLPNLRINKEKGSIHGSVISIDIFGNIITNITLNSLKKIGMKPDNITLSINNHTIKNIQLSYSHAPQDSPMMLINSSNYLEIAVNMGNASKSLNADLYDNVRVSACKEKN